MAGTQEYRAFERKLDRVLRTKTDVVRRLAGRKKPGRAPRFNRQKALREVADLAELAREAVVREIARDEFYDSFVELRQWHPKRGKGHGIAAKRRAFKEWYRERIGTRTVVYIFWSKRRCVYVGRTGKGGSRPEKHFERFWFRSVTRIDIYVIPQRRILPAAECLAMDLYQPTRNKIRSSRPRYRSKCPVCSRVNAIERELKQLFRVR